MSSDLNNSSTDEGVIAGPLDGVRIENGAFVCMGETADEAQEHESKTRFREVVAKIIDDGKFHRFMCRVYGRIGRKYELEALQNRETDPDFREACDLLYSDLKDSVLGPAIDYFASETLEKILVYGVGFGVPIWDAMDEAKVRKSEVENAEAFEQEINEEAKGPDNGE